MMKKTPLPLLLVALSGFAFGADNVPPTGFTALFDGRQISGWYGWGTRDPKDLLALPPEQQAEYKRQSVEGGPGINKTNPKTGKTAEEHINAHWKVDGGELVNDGHGLYLSTEKDYGDIELLVDYKMLPKVQRHLPPRCAAGADLGLHGRQRGRRKTRQAEGLGRALEQ